MTYNKETLKEAIVQKLRLNYGCPEQQATDGEMMKACAMVPVSYTHLDVYKRQAASCPSGTSGTSAASWTGICGTIPPAGPAMSACCS